MTSLAEKLQHLRDLGENATPGPWVRGELERECIAGFGGKIQDFATHLHKGGVILRFTNQGDIPRPENEAFICASRTALPKLVEFVEAVRERHKPEHRYNGTTAVDCGCKVEVLDEDCRWPRCAGCQLTYPCPDIEALSRLGEGL